MDRGVQVDKHGVKSKQCTDCSRKVELHNSWENECDCGSLYNGSGQKLMTDVDWSEEYS